MNLCKEVCLRVLAHLWSTKLAHLSASQFKNSNLSSCNMRGQGKNVLKCVPTHQKWPNYQEFLAHLAGYFCTCEYTMFRYGTKWFIYQECSFIQRSIYVECTYIPRLLVQVIMTHSPGAAIFHFQERDLEDTLLS